MHFPSINVNVIYPSTFEFKNEMNIILTYLVENFQHYFWIYFKYFTFAHVTNEMHHETRDNKERKILFPFLEKILLINMDTNWNVQKILGHILFPSFTLLVAWHFKLFKEF